MVTHARPGPPPARDGWHALDAPDGIDECVDAELRTIVLCDPLTLFRDGLARLLPASGPFQVVAETASVDATLRRLRDLDPYAIVAATELEDGTIDDLARRLVETNSQARLVAMCTENHSCANFGVPVDAAVRRGAPVEDLLDALSAPDTAPVRTVVPRPRPTLAGPCGSDAASMGLTPRLICILTLVARGWPNRDIARWLGLSEATIRDYLTGAYRSLHVRSRTEAALAMLRRGYGPEV